MSAIGDDPDVKIILSLKQQCHYTVSQKNDTDVLYYNSTHIN